MDGGIIYIGSIEKPTKDFFFNFCILLYKQVFLEKHTQKYGEVIDFSFPYHITPCHFNGIIYTTGFLCNIRMLIYVYIRSMAKDRIRSINRSKLAHDRARARMRAVMAPSANIVTLASR